MRLLMHKSKLVITSVFVFFSWSFVLIDAQALENKDNSPGRMLVLSAGNIGVVDELEESTFGGIDYRMLPFSKLDLIPALGFIYKDGGASYTYIDLRYDFWLSDDWGLVPGYGVGLFHKDDEIDLGGSLEFRASLEVSYRFDNDYRLGLTIFHLSNGSIYGSNPGTEAIGIALSIPLHD